MKIRCEWAGEDPVMVKYHDQEWGVPVHNDRKHLEFLILEGAQAGLSWATILKRRSGYKRLYKNFNPKVVSKFTKRDVERMLKDEGIIRNRLKVESSIENAKLFLGIQKEFGSFDKYVWRFVGGKPINNKIMRHGDYKVTTKESDALSKDLKSRGFKFVGSTIIYAHMQATGLVNDHMVKCFRDKQV